MNCIFDGDGIVGPGGNVHDSSDAFLSDVITNRDKDVMAVRKVALKTANKIVSNKYNTFVYGDKQIIPAGSNVEAESKRAIEMKKHPFLSVWPELEE